MGEIRVGTSGWAYPSWRGDFFPRGLVQRQELSYLAERLSALEINGSFYALQKPTSYRRWREATPDDFVFAVKGSRFITHLKRLRDVDQALARFFGSGLEELGPKLGPVLWQLPATQTFDRALLADFYALLPRTLGGRRVRHALEFRHRSFCVDEAFAQLREHDIACVVSDSPGRWPMAEAVTSDLVYVRLHGPDPDALYGGSYSADDLRWWADRIREWTAQDRDVVVYFNNDLGGNAVRNARDLKVALSR